MAMAVVAGHLLFIGVLTTSHITSGLESSRSRGVLVERSPLEGIYRVESFVQAGLADRDNEDSARWVQVGYSSPPQRPGAPSPPMYVSGILLANGDYQRTRVTLTATEPEEGVIRLEGQVQGKATVIIMRKEASEPLLKSRGFRWINEVPFNR